MKEVWFLVCSAKELPQGKVISFPTKFQDFVLFRNVENEIVALEAHCSHLGAHLGNATWSKDGIRCSLHEICFDSNGNSLKSKLGLYKQKRFITKEEFGSVFVYFGRNSNPIFPELNLIPKLEQMYESFPGKKIFTNWEAILINAFDPIHLEYVHKRRLVDEPQIRWDKKKNILEFRYNSEVIGTKFSDYIMKWISNNHIKVRIQTYHGYLFTVESDLGKFKSQLLLSLNPFPSHTMISGILIQKKSFPFLNSIRMFFAGFLFKRFLLADIKPLEGMNVNHENLKKDPYLSIIGDYLKSINEPI
ncbi:Rieske 2Fe-2S domain-containing protein [Leptospira mtsangambouensis]|uniref:Rieske 2Fe-2S domain-containing protein n=1 Tax=Leptospira mtsangambouensis TaxID=2484912 RepID=UPI00142D94A6|nr:Rieske 2Fe-2S domain-containing protein [Leptospira mtsangambouensis]